ncbi:Hypothetical predicted protein, partial [Paramuricea clavata]
FSASVALALETKTLTGNLRHEFVRDICTHISSNGVYFLNKLERNLVATAIVTKYPFRKDPIGSGLVSLLLFVLFIFDSSSLLFAVILNEFIRGWLSYASNDCTAREEPLGYDVMAEVNFA